jgi:hypothetical protein
MTQCIIISWAYHYPVFNMQSMLPVVWYYNYRMLLTLLVCLLTDCILTTELPDNNDDDALRQKVFRYNEVLNARCICWLKAVNICKTRGTSRLKVNRQSRTAHDNHIDIPSYETCINRSAKIGDNSASGTAPTMRLLFRIRGIPGSNTGLQWRTREFFFRGEGFNKFSGGERTESTGIWGAGVP